MKIDIHAHVIDRKYVDDLVADAGLYVTHTASGQTLLRKDGHTFAWYREAMFDLDSRLRDMDRQGVDMRILSLSTPNVYEWHGARQVEAARHINDVTAAMVRKHPDRFAALGSLPMENVEASLVELERITGELGMKGVAIDRKSTRLNSSHT